MRERLQGLLDRVADGIGWGALGAGAALIAVAGIILAGNTFGWDRSEHKAVSPQTTITSPGTPTSRGSPSATSSPSAVCTNMSLLTKQVAGFTKAYYRLDPDPRFNAAVRRQLVAPYATSAYLQSADLSVSSGTAADAARIKEKLVISGQIFTDLLVANPVGSSSTTMQVVVPVAITSAVPGQANSSFTVKTTSQWQCQSGRWLVSAFTEGGELAE